MMSILDHPIVSSRYFFPRPDRPRRVVPVAVDGAILACAEHRPHGGDAPLLLHFHGNGEVVADYVPDFAEVLAAAGLDTFFVEYRGYGASTGVPAIVQMLGDVERVIEHIGHLGVPDERIFVYGRSVGSIYAIEAAHRRPRLGGLILESGIADPLSRVLLRVAPAELGVSAEDVRREASAHLDHERKLRGFPGRVLVLHAADDELVDVSHARSNASWAPRSELVVFPHGGHNAILAYNLDAIVASVARFVAQSDADRSP